MQYYATEEDVLKLDQLAEVALRALRLARTVRAMAPGEQRDATQGRYDSDVVRIKTIVVDL